MTTQQGQDVVATVVKRLQEQSGEGEFVKTVKNGLITNQSRLNIRDVHLRDTTEHVSIEKDSTQIRRVKITAFAVIFCFIMAIWNKNWAHVLLLALIVGVRYQKLWKSGSPPSFGATVADLYSSRPILLISLSSALLRHREWSDISIALMRSSSLLAVPYLYWAYAEKTDKIVSPSLLLVINPYIQSVHSNVTAHPADSPSFPYVQILFCCCVLANGSPSRGAVFLHVISFLSWLILLCLSISSGLCIGNCQKEIMTSAVHSSLVFVLIVYFYMNEDMKLLRKADFVATKEMLLSDEEDPGAKLGNETPGPCPVKQMTNCCCCKSKANGWRARLDWPNAFVVITYQVLGIVATIVSLLLGSTTNFAVATFVHYKENLHAVVVFFIFAVSVISVWPWTHMSEISVSDRRFIIRYTTFSVCSLMLRFMWQPSKDEHFAIPVIAYWFFEISAWLLTGNWPLRAAHFDVIMGFTIIYTQHV